MGATYQRLMNKIFANHIETLTKVYIDDVLVKTMKEEELLPNLEIVFDCLHKHRMSLNPQKCAFAIEAGTFLVLCLHIEGLR